MVSRTGWESVSDLMGVARWNADAGDVLSETARFWAEVRRQLLAESAQPCATFQAVLPKMRGVFPTDALRELTALGIELPIGIAREVRSDRTGPDLHPLDYEWYFDRHTSQTIARIFDFSLSPVACLGAPTVAHALIGLNRPSVLFDKSPFAMQRAGKHTLIRQVLIDASRSIDFDRDIGGVFFDAPWYPEYVLYWLWQASRLLKGTGIIGFSLFPDLTRPSARRERDFILGEAEKLGSVSIREGELIYETPSFEAEVLKQHNLSGLTHWRHADLVIIEANATHQMAEPTPPSGEDEWETFVICNQVVKLKCISGAEMPWLLQPVQGVGSYIFGTVSRRAPIRKSIHLWTSRNRVASVGNRTLVRQVLATMTEGNSLRYSIDKALPTQSAIERQSVEDAFGQALGMEC